MELIVIIMLKIVIVNIYILFLLLDGYVFKRLVNFSLSLYYSLVRRYFIIFILFYGWGDRGIESDLVKVI